MFINDIHVLYYFFIGLLGVFVGQYLDFANTRLENHESLICKDFFREYLPNMKINLKNMAIIAVIYVALLYRYGLTIKLLEMLILSPMFVSVFVIDYRKQIIPDRLSLLIFEVGIIFMFIEGFSSINLLIDKSLGMVAGAGIFLIITIIGGLIAGKEAMGFGDVKLMGALGAVFGLSNIIIISVLAFLFAAIISIILLATKIKKGNEYIPFGPFIILATFTVIFVPNLLLTYILIKIFTLGTYNG